jgi:hypothetical protein
MQPLESTHTDKYTTKNNGDACEGLERDGDVIDGVPRLDEDSDSTRRLDKSRNVSCVFLTGAINN